MIVQTADASFASPEILEQSPRLRTGEAPPASSARTTKEAANVLRATERRASSESRVGSRIRRSPAGTWNADEVAAHLMGCQRQMVRGLGRKSPWAGLDDETLASCFGHGAAVISRVAASGQRQEWRTTGDLEKAQIAAFRHQALDHWKRVNALSRQSERFTVAFDADRHGVPDAPLDRLFDQPDLVTITRDLLAELVDEDLRGFWRLVLLEHVTFKEAGDRRGLTRAGVMSATRAGRTAFAGYLDRRSTGALCAERALDVLANRAGSATPLGVERAEAHLESCYVCALVHEPRTSAIQRGILGLAPTGFILRMLAKAGDAASTPAMRIADSGSGSRAAAAVVAAVAVAGSGVGIKVAEDEQSSDGQQTIATPRAAAPILAGPRLRVNPPPAVEPAAFSEPSSPSRLESTPRRASASDRAKGKSSRLAARRTSTDGSPAASPPKVAEFDFEAPRQPATTPAGLTPTPPSAPPGPPPIVDEFDLP